MADEGKTAPTWISGLPEDLRTHKSIEKFKDQDVSVLAKSYIELEKFRGNSISCPGVNATAEEKNAFFQKLMSVDGVTRIPTDDTPSAERETFLDKISKLPDVIKVPGKEATEEEMGAFLSKIGKPKEFSEYEVDETKVSKDFADKLRKEAFDLGLTKVQAKKWMDRQLDTELKRKENLELSKNANLEVLRREWGDSFYKRLDGAEKTLNYMVKKYPSLNEVLTPELKTNAAIMSMLAEVGKALSDTGSSGLELPRYGDSRADIEAKINEINKNPILLNSTHPEHNLIKSKRNQLYQMLRPFLESV